MSEQPTGYDLQQDEQIRRNTQMIKPDYTPFDGPEYSFPVVGQGINSEQFRLISRAAGTGVFIPHSSEEAHHPYRLHSMPGGDTETNAKNQMMLRTSAVNGRSESSIDGFFHIQQEDMVIDLPAVSSPTTYHICVTLDPEDETETFGPMRIRTFPGTPPTSKKRKHLVLWTVHREPNQLLTNATITRTRQWVSPAISVLWYENLPDPHTTEYGTIAVVLNSRQSSNDAAPSVYINRGPLRWVPIIEGVGQWERCRPSSGWQHSSTPLEARITPLGIQLRGALNGENPDTTTSMARLPSGFPTMPHEFRFHVVHTNSVHDTMANIGSRDGDMNLIRIQQSRSNFGPFPRFDGIIIPYN